jgi:hypothetical protein
MGSKDTQEFSDPARLIESAKLCPGPNNVETKKVGCARVYPHQNI